jgi:hypothetical protein
VVRPVPERDSRPLRLPLTTTWPFRPTVVSSLSIVGHRRTSGFWILIGRFQLN